MAKKISLRRALGLTALDLFSVVLAGIWVVLVAGSWAAAHVLFFLSIAGIDNTKPNGGARIDYFWWGVISLGIMALLLGVAFFVVHISKIRTESGASQ